MTSTLAIMGLGLWGIVSNGVGHDVPAVGAMPAELRVPAAPQAIVIPLFKPKEFPFVTTMPDDGKEPAGGWQVAKVNLEFITIVIPTDVKVWHCRFSIEMPLRTEKMGKVDASRAARMSAEVANVVGAGMDHDLPQGIFCDKFIADMRPAFKAKYPSLGARVTK